MMMARQVEVGKLAVMDYNWWIECFPNNYARGICGPGKNGGDRWCSDEANPDRGVCLAAPTANETASGGAPPRAVLGRPSCECLAPDHCAAAAAQGMCHQGRPKKPKPMPKAGVCSDPEAAADLLRARAEAKAARRRRARARRARRLREAPRGGLAGRRARDRSI